MARTRILLAEDNEALLAELCRELKDEFEIVGTASNGQDAVDGVLRLDPDVIVLASAWCCIDLLNSPDLSGKWN